MRKTNSLSLAATMAGALVASFYGMGRTYAGNPDAPWDHSFKMRKQNRGKSTYQKPNGGREMQRRLRQIKEGRLSPVYSATDINRLVHVNDMRIAIARNHGVI
jgi:hypothetical protein